MITPFAQWPSWLQTLILAPNALLAGIMCWFWWPKSNREWNKFGILAAYLIVFFVVMHYVFKF